MRSVRSESAPKTYQSFVVGIEADPLISEHSGTRHCIEVSLSPWVAHRLFQGADTDVGKEAIAHHIMHQFLQVRSVELAAAETSASKL
ncbi:MAG: hypothetical protein KME20_16040 [Kaiparowitsia implicata GSE-PSE-MK54-09C]|jgi:hypothetical protein|nr:hypothetical protein [Kaiparowitsia implicata GSE-PSE-MK54-09C]